MSTSSDKFTFDKVKDNLNAIVSEYENYVDNTSTANENVSTFINAGDGSGVNSSTVGTWFAAIWNANTTYAEEFKSKFTEWSQTVTNIMITTGDMDEEAQALFTSYEGLAELQYKYFNFNRTGFSGSNARLMIDAEKVYDDFVYNYYQASQTDSDVKFDPTAMQEFLASNPNAKNYILDKAIVNANDYISRVFQERMDDPGLLNEDGKFIINTKGASPVLKEVYEYYNEYQKMPTADDLKIFDIDDWSVFDPNPEVKTPPPGASEK